MVSEYDQGRLEVHRGWEQPYAQVHASLEGLFFVDPTFKGDLFDVYEVCLCIHTYDMHAWYLCLLQKQQVLLTAEPFLQPPGASFVPLTYLGGSGRHRSQAPTPRLYPW